MLRLKGFLETHSIAYCNQHTPGQAHSRYRVQNSDPKSSSQRPEQNGTEKKLY